MSEDAQERTEEATPKRKQEMRQKGQTIRSKELLTMLNLFGAGVGLIVMGSWMMNHFVELISTLYTLEGDAFFDKKTIFKVCEYTVTQLINILWPFLLIVFVAICLGPSMLGGWVFSGQQITPKLERLDPIKGLKKMVSMKGFVELIKSILKILLVTGICAVLMWALFEEFMKLGQMPLMEGVSHSLGWVLFIFMTASSATIIITLIDIPFQIFDFSKQSKMTKQQVKDEFKETEGRPEVKSKIRSLQRQMAKMRMMDEVAKADVVITNPTHYAVALKYNESMSAPILVAKGMDLVAARIRDKAQEHDIPLVSLPPLARAIYFSTELEDEVPNGLYKAVAKVLAYIYQLRQYKRGKSSKPKLPKELDIPDEFQR